jgi:hypothetical protein
LTFTAFFIIITFEIFFVCPIFFRFDFCHQGTPVQDTKVFSLWLFSQYAQFYNRDPKHGGEERAQYTSFNISAGKGLNWNLLAQSYKVAPRAAGPSMGEKSERNILPSLSMPEKA